MTTLNTTVRALFVLAAAGQACAQSATFAPLGNVDGGPGVNVNGCYLSDTGFISGDGSIAFGTSFIPGNYGAGAVAGFPFFTETDTPAAAFLVPGDFTLGDPIAVSFDGLTSSRTSPTSASRAAPSTASSRCSP